MSENIGFEPISRTTWQAYKRSDDSDLMKKADASFTFLFTDFTPAQFLDRMFVESSNIFRPGDVQAVEFQAEDWVPGALGVRIEMPEFEVWLESAAISDESPFILRFANEKYWALCEKSRRHRIEVHFGLYSHWSDVPHHLSFIPTIELIDIAMEKPERFLFKDCYGDSQPPRVLKPGVYMRSVHSEPDHIFVEDFDILTWSDQKIELGSQQTPMLVERYPNAHVIRGMKDFEFDYYDFDHEPAVIPRLHAEEEQIVQAIFKTRPTRRTDPFPSEGLAGDARYSQTQEF